MAATRSIRKKRRLLRVIDFDQRNARRVIGTANNGSVFAGWQSSQNNRFERVNGGQPGGRDLSCLCVLPIVVGGDDGTTRVAYFERWVGQWIGDACLRKRRSDRADHQEVVEQ